MTQAHTRLTASPIAATTIASSYAITRAWRRLSSASTASHTATASSDKPLV